jgi:hypothetical protein
MSMADNTYVDNTYNGWTNWETWIVIVWMDNDQKLYEYYGDITREEISKDKQSATYKLSTTLREQFDEGTPGIEGLYLDLLNGAMREINWHEITKHLVERVEEEENYAQQAN